jgi:hypothetical protein
MSISFVGQNSSATTSVDLSGIAMQRGDLLIAFVTSASGTRVTRPAGWQSLFARSLGTGVPSVFFRPVIDGTETATGFTNAVAMVVCCYRHTANWLSVGNFVGGNYSSLTTIAFPAYLSYATVVNSNNVSRTAGDGWIFAGATATVPDVGVATAPSGMVTRSSATGSSREIAIYDTNSNAETYPQTNLTLSSFASGGFFIADFHDSGIPKSGGASRPMNPFNQQVIR